MQNAKLYSIINGPIPPYPQQQPAIYHPILLGHLKNKINSNPLLSFQSILKYIK